LDQLIHHFPYTAYRAPYETLPLSPHLLFSITVAAVGAVAIAAAFGMVKSSRVACVVWLVLLGLSMPAFLAYVVVGFVSWGLRANETVIAICWEASYVAAFAMARWGANLGKAGTA
jgi:hypothetical protein